ncbi:MAG TPA: TolC family protein, partial [Sphingomonadaceae bacterium]|nr:TolC family protein [Sphingomonadaceae bacterium]
AARIGVATADLFPTVSLGGSVGLGGAPLSSLGTAGSPFFALGPRVTWNLFDRRAIYARIREQDSVAAANLARDEAAVTGALGEGDSALNAWINERERRSRLDAARESSRNASRLARLRYREGVEDFLAVLDAERNLLAIEDQLAQSEINLAQGVIAIQLALGSGWEATSAPAHTPYVEQD